jgi:hypothetical protein
VSGQADTPDAILPRETAPATHWIGGWVDPRAGLNKRAKSKKISSLPLPGIKDYKERKQNKIKEQRDNYVENTYTTFHISFHHMAISKGIIYAETERFMLAIQYQAKSTRNYRKYILKEQTQSDRCRRCTKCPKPLHQCRGGSSSPAATRHDNVVSSRSNNSWH